MGKQLLASKIVITEEAPRLRSIPSIPTAVIGYVGVTKMGPHAATLCTSWEEFEDKFGGHYAGSELPMSVWGTYMNDPGARVWIKRVVHYVTGVAQSAQATVNILSTIATAAAGSVTGTVAAPWVLAAGDTLLVDIDATGDDTATFDAASAKIVGGAASGLPVTNGAQFVVRVDSWGVDQTITYSAAHTTVELVAQDINAQAKGFRAIVVGGATIDFEADTQGTGSSIELKSQTSTALTDIGHSVAAATTGTGDVANILAVTFAEAKAVIEADVTGGSGCTVTQHASGYLIITSNTTGAASSVQVSATSTAETKFGLDTTLHSGSATTTDTTLIAKGKYDGTYAHGLRVVIAAATSGVSGYYNLSVTDANGVILEVFPNLQSATTTATDFVETVVNDADAGSKLITVVDQAVALTPDNGTYTPAAGNDGLTGLADSDYTGSSSYGNGFHGMNTIQNVSIMAAPGRATQAVEEGLVQYCETYRDGTIFPVLDPPSGTDYAAMVTYMKTTTTLTGLSEFGAMYWPRIKVLNPEKTIYGTSDTMYVYPSGWVCGVISRTDNSKPGGIYEPPAGVEVGLINGCLGFEYDSVLREPVRDVIYPERINPITTEETFGRFIDGVYTLKGTGSFPTIAERRGVIYMERSMKLGLQFARHRNNDSELRAACQRTVEAFLYRQMNLGAFRSKDPTTAYHVDFSDALNPPSEQFALKLNGRVGLATQKPAEFITVAISQDTRAFEEEIAA